MIATKKAAIRMLRMELMERFDLEFPTPDRVFNDQTFLDWVDACVKDRDMPERARDWSLTHKEGGQG